MMNVQLKRNRPSLLHCFSRISLRYMFGRNELLRLNYNLCYLKILTTDRILTDLLEITVPFYGTAWTKCGRLYPINW